MKNINQSQFKIIQDNSFLSSNSELVFYQFQRKNVKCFLHSETYILPIMFGLHCVQIRRTDIRFLVWVEKQQSKMKQSAMSSDNNSVIPSTLTVPKSFKENKLVQEKIQEILTHRRLCFLKERMFEYYGKNYPINYKSYYGFEEKWQNKDKKPSLTPQYRIKFRNKLQECIYVYIVLCNTLALWLCTISITIDGLLIQKIKQIILSCAIVAQILDFFLKISGRADWKPSKQCLKIFVSTSYKKIIFVIYFAVKVRFTYEASVNWTIFLQIVTLCLLYFEIKKLYNSLRVSNFSSQYQYHFKVADLIINLLIIGHIMALMLYTSTKAGYRTNWLQNLNLGTNQALVFYLYAFYFSTTTIFTVGYGDITPTNPIEVLTVILVQVCGIVMLAYIINEIGFCLSSPRKNQQLLEKDLQVLQKMKKQYFLQQDLMQRANQYLVNSYEKAYQLTPEQQEGLIKKLNQQLREQIQKASLISVVKSSIFLVCRWTYRMQKAVSLKLIHTLFSPNDTIYQPQGKQRLYFIRSGTSGVYADLKVRKTTKKLLKIITSTLNKQISNNCYGYTATISSRSTILEAIAKQFTSAYYITKQNFFNCVCENLSDFQYFHQLKTKIELSRVTEALQVPFLVNSKQHYNPNRLKIIYNQINRQGRNRRNVFKRRIVKIKNRKLVNPDDKIMANQYYSQETLTKDFTKEKFSIVFNTLLGNDHVDEVKSDQLFNYKEKDQKAEREIKKSKTLIKTLVNDKKNLQFYVHLVHYFESVREYGNYFAKQNRSNILNRLQKQLFVIIPKKKDNKEKMTKEFVELIKSREQI